MSLDELKVIDVSNIITVRHDPEIWPNKGAMTLRSLCASSPENKDLLTKLQTVVDSNNLVCDESLFEGEFEVISTIEEVKKLLSEVIIRFDTQPEYYTKEDYQFLISLLYRSLYYLHERAVEIPYIHAGKGIQVTGPFEQVKISSTVEKDIVVTGVSIGNISSGDVVEKGKDLTEVLQQLLVKELDVEVIFPTVSMFPSGIKQLEYGTKVSSEEITATLTEGQFVSPDPKLWDMQPINMNCGITDAFIDSTQGDIKDNTVTFKIPDFILTEHTRIFPILTVSKNTTPVYTNLGNKSMKTYSGGNLAPDTILEYSPYYKVFHGNYPGTDLNNIIGTDIRNLRSDNVTVDNKTKEINKEFSTSGGSLVIACPSNYSLINIQNSLGAPILDNFIFQEVISVKCGEQSVNYKVYMYPIANGTKIEYKNLKFETNGQT